MRNSLLYKLMGAFLLVVLIGAVVISLLLVGSTRSAFTRYSNRNGQVIAARLADRLGNYYSLNGSWVGVEDYLNLEEWTGIENGQGSMMRMGRMMPGSGIVAAMDLADHPCRPGWQNHCRFPQPGSGRPVEPAGAKEWSAGIGRRDPRGNHINHF